MKVQTAFWKREVISSGHEPGAHKHNPGPALPGGYSSLFPRGCTNGGGSPALPAHHSPLSLRRSQGNSGAVQGTRYLHVGKWSPHTSAFSAPPPASGLLRTTTPHPPPPVPSTHGSKQKLSREELLCSFHSGSAAAKKTSREHWAIPAPGPRGSCVS